MDNALSRDVTLECGVRRVEISLLFGIALVLVPLDHLTLIIVNAESLSRTPVTSRKSKISDSSLFPEPQQIDVLRMQMQLGVNLSGGLSEEALAEIERLCKIL
jgi:hypothetical protein